MVSECVWGVYSSVWSTSKYWKMLWRDCYYWTHSEHFFVGLPPAVVCFFSPVLGLGGANLLTSSTPKSTQLQLTWGRSTPPSVCFKGLLHSASPRQFIVKLHVVMFGSLKQASACSLSTPGWVGWCVFPVLQFIATQPPVSRLVCTLHLPSSPRHCNQVKPTIVQHIKPSPAFVFSSLRCGSASLA